MLKSAAHTRSLSEFKRNSRTVLRRLRRTGEPLLLTVRGKARAVVQDAEAFRQAVQMIERAEAIVAIQEGLDAVDRGDTRPARAALRKLRRKHEVPS